MGDMGDTRNRRDKGDTGLKRVKEDTVNKYERNQDKGDEEWRQYQKSQRTDCV
jgi:hypothetical protein